MAIKTITVFRCGDNRKPLNLVVEETIPLVVNGVYSMSGVSEFNQFRLGCYTVLKITDNLIDLPNAVLITDYGIDGCETCLDAITDSILFTTCSGYYKDSAIFPKTDFSPVPSIGDFFYLDYYTSSGYYNSGRINGCYEVNRYTTSSGYIGGEFSLVSSSAKTSCEDCSQTSPLTYLVRDCVNPDNIFFISFPTNQFVNHLITFTDLDSITQYCGIVEDKQSTNITGVFISDLGIPTETGIECEDCLSTVAEKKKLVNCLNPSDEIIVWASTLFTAGDATNLSFNNGCYEVSLDVVPPETPVDVNEFVEFDPHSDCENCLECHGATYEFSSCTEIYGCGVITEVTPTPIPGIPNYGYKNFVFDSGGYVYTISDNGNCVQKIDLSTNSIMDSSVCTFANANSLALDEVNGIICTADYNSNRIFFIDANDMSNSWTIIPSDSSLCRYVYYNPNDGLFYLTFENSGPDGNIRVYGGTSYSGMTQMSIFGSPIEQYSSIVEVSSPGQLLVLGKTSEEIFSFSPYPSLTPNASINLLYNPLYFDYDGLNILYILFNNANVYGKFDITANTVSYHSFSPSCFSPSTNDSIKINPSTNRLYITSYNCGLIYEFDTLTDTLIQSYSSVGNPFGSNINPVDNETWFSNYKGFLQVGCENQFITGELLSYEYVPIGDVFFNPILSACCEVTNIYIPNFSSFGPTNTALSLITFSGGCEECIATEFDVFSTQQCDVNFTPIFGSTMAAPAGQYQVGDFVKSHWGNSNLFCYEIISKYEYNNLPDYGYDIFESEGHPPYSSCTDCEGESTVGITIINCNTLVESYVNIKLSDWVIISGYNGTIPKQTISDKNGNCYRIVNTCPIDNSYQLLEIKNFYLDCYLCNLSNSRKNPRNSGSEVTVCISLCDQSVVSINPPHPVWTDGYDAPVTQLNMITIGGNGLNS